jgi:aromatic ring-opening dioxygenase catalytic subunit (LigB family)
MSGKLVDNEEFAARQIEWNTALENVLDDEDNNRQMAALQGWRKLPHSYEMHPRGAAEHFNTLLLCAGAARSEEKVHCLKSEIWGAVEASFWWE